MIFFYIILISSLSHFYNLQNKVLFHKLTYLRGISPNLNKLLIHPGIFYLLAGEKVYYNTEAGTIDYDSGKITINPVFISAILDVDGVSSTRIRITAIPSSNDIVPVRNQVLEIDEVNTTITGTVDTISTSGVGYTTTTTGGVTTTTVATTSSTPTTSAY